MKTASRPPFGFARRVAALFAVASITLLTLAVVVTRHVDSMHRSLERLAEEQRETDSAMYLLHHLRMLDVHASKMSAEHWKAPSPERDELNFHAEQALATLQDLRLGPDGEDPSSGEHAADEERLYVGLERELAALRTALGQDVAAEQVLPAVAELLRLAEVLNDEVHAEEERASSALSAEATDVRSAVFWAAMVAMAVLLAVLALVHHSVVAPLVELRAGAGRIAAGELEHRVQVRTRDEVGELAQEFNRMAGELAGMHAELEQRVAERTREFTRAARLAGLGTMAAGIAHEINNPLASIASCAEGLERRLRAGQAEPAEQLEYLEIIAKEAYRAHEITSRLLEFARSDPGPLVEYRPTEVMQGVDVLVRHRLRERELQLVVDCPSDLPLVRGRPSECRQIVLNLLHNAIDASPQGGRIDMRCRLRDEGIALEVEDQGPGLPPQVAERVFDPFFTTKPPGKGTGLGLSIVERIVASHGGRVEAFDTGHGALFRVTLPLELEHAP